MPAHRVSFCRSPQRSFFVQAPEPEGANLSRGTGLSHDLITVTNSPAPKTAQQKFRQLVSRPESQSQSPSQTPNKPVAVVHSLSLSTSYSLATAQSSMDEWLALAQSTNRDTPFLWVGPTAPGHQKPSTDNVHASSWQYTLDAAEAARSRGMETLGMYNATLQAGSWDGVHYGEKVALMQAMMVGSGMLHCMVGVVD